MRCINAVGCVKKRHVARCIHKMQAILSVIDTNIVSKISKFADGTKLWHIARNPYDIMELQEDNNKLVEWRNKWQMNFNVDKSSVMHIGHKNMQGNYNMSNQQLPTTDQKRDLRIIITRDLVSKTNRDKLQNGQQSTGVH